MRPAPVLLLAAICACSSTPSGGVKVEVRFLDTDAQCARVYVTGAGSLVRVTGPLPRTGRDKVVGISQDGYTGASVDVVARGYLASDCSGLFLDSSQVEHRDFVAGEMSASALLVLNGNRRDGGPVDGGQSDGGQPEDAGTDAGAGDAGFDGGGGTDAGPEQCGNGIDDDLDGQLDCFDSDCLQQGCGAGRRCVSIGVCQIPLVEAVCNDGLDDDGDSAIDCADDDCDRRVCSDANLCTWEETCQLKVCTAAVTLTCSMPSECQQGTGACLADAGCSYGPKTGSCDGGTCNNGECVVGFPFTPSNGFNPAIPVTAIAARVTLNCGLSTFDSDTGLFGNWCNQPTPVPRTINRLGVQDLVVLPMAGLDLQNELRLTGSKPVILAVFGDASITGTLSASARRAADGPGGPSDDCLFFGAPGSTFIYSSGGGGGAGFAQAGTRGGNSGGNPLSGGAGGATYPVAPNLVLRGGCAGGDGASGMMGQLGGPGGGAGGAVQLSVSGTLTVNGKVSANGGGGTGGTSYNAAGGGGGSGGGILLEASLLRVLAGARVTAQGGGGGGGARDNDDGTNGADGNDAAAGPAAGGTKGGGQAGNGGKGGAAASPTNAGDGTTSAGGGGGAGAGRIHLRSIATCVVAGGRVVSPAATGDCP